MSQSMLPGTTAIDNLDKLIAWLPDLILTKGRFERDLALMCDQSGRIVKLAGTRDTNCRVIRLGNRALLPGLINAHSHAFQRVIRGRTEYRTSRSTDSFWTWRKIMYGAAMRLKPEDLYRASRMAFLEMALTGITSVGEFHYLHRPPAGGSYDDPNLLAKTVISAATDVGIRIALFRVAYGRSGFGKEINEQQTRFIEVDPDEYLKNVERLRHDLSKGDLDRAWTGVAPHSIRAVPLGYLKHIVTHANNADLRVHMHIAEQPAEVTASIEEYGCEPIELLDREGLLSERFTCIHAIHVGADQIQRLAAAQALVCACPTTERSLGDGIFPADLYFREGIHVSVGSDSHIQIDLLEDSRELEYHMRLKDMKRAVLARELNAPSELAARLFECASAFGAESIGASAGKLEPGRSADFFTIDLNDPSIAGAEENSLLANIVFSSSRAAVRDVVVGGKMIVSDGHHAAERAIIADFNSLQSNLWG